MEWIDTALILRTGKIRETDLWVRMLTKKRGIISAFAFGASRSRKRFCGCLDLLNIVHVRAKHSKQFLNLEEGSLIQGPIRLRKDTRRFGMFINCIKFLDAINISADGAGLAFSLTKGMLDLLESDEQVHDMMPIFYRFRLAADQGYVPDFSSCSSCGGQIDGHGFFDMPSGMLFCPSCNKGGKFIDKDICKGLLLIQKNEPNAWNNMDLSPAQIRQCNIFIADFIEYHLGIVWKNGRFCKS